MNDETQGGVVTILTLPVRHPLVGDEADKVIRELAGRDLPVVVVTDARSVHLWPQRDMSTREEVAVLRCCAAHTDARLVWHPCR